MRESDRGDPEGGQGHRGTDEEGRHPSGVEESRVVLIGSAACRLAVGFLFPLHWVKRAGGLIIYILEFIPFIYPELFINCVVSSRREFADSAEFKTRGTRSQIPENLGHVPEFSTRLETPTAPSGMKRKNKRRPCRDDPRLRYFFTLCPLTVWCWSAPRGTVLPSF